MTLLSTLSVCFYLRVVVSSMRMWLCSLHHDCAEVRGTEGPLTLNVCFSGAKVPLKPVQALQFQVATMCIHDRRENHLACGVFMSSRMFG
eukprot:3822373-Amphidinium_carterae.1